MPTVARHGTKPTNRATTSTSMLVVAFVCAGLLAAAHAAAATPVPSRVTDDFVGPPEPERTSEVDPVSGLPVVRFDVAGSPFRFEVAGTFSARARGLGGRERLAPDHGMVFVYRRALTRRFWMKDCLIPIDAAFVDADGRIVALHRMPKPPDRAATERLVDYEARLERYSSRRPAKYVLEFAAGTLDRLQLRIGQQLPLPMKRLDALCLEDD